MYVRADSLDDLLAKVYRQILARGTRIKPTKGPAREIYGVLLKLSAPRLRLSRTESRGILFSCLGELLWILAGSNALDFIEHYISEYKKSSDDELTIHGADRPLGESSKECLPWPWSASTAGVRAASVEASIEPGTSPRAGLCASRRRLSH